MVSEGTNDLGGNGDGGSDRKEETGMERWKAAEIAEWEGLSAEKRTAIQWLVRGKTMEESAKLAGVTRVTIYRWMKSDAGFKAAHNEWQQAVTQTTRSRLLMLTDKAVDAVKKALEEGNAKLGLQLLNQMGMLAPTPPGPTDAEEARKEMEREKKRRERRDFLL
jgi:hypothetical protein